MENRKCRIQDTGCRMEDDTPIGYRVSCELVKSLREIWNIVSGWEQFAKDTVGNQIARLRSMEIGGGS